MELTFLGAAGTVTGSKYLVETGTTRLLVDCGLYQGVKNLRRRNWAELPVEPSGIDAVVLSHAHLDHSGFVPRLVAKGFSGPVYASPPTAALLRILWPDAGRIQEEDAEYARRKRFSRHDPPRPLFTESDAFAALESVRPIPFRAPLEVGDLEVELSRAGHILGAASVGLRHRGRSLLLSGDLGRDDDLLMPPPERPDVADWVVVESTYGNRVHDRRDPFEAVAEIMRRTFERGGTLLIPSFAVGRAQNLLYCLHQIFDRGLAPRVPVFVNSPMATDATDLYRRFHDEHRLDVALCAEVFGLPRYVASVDESRALAAREGPLVILSASGMATGGRVLHHLKALAPQARNTILLPGFQAPGTRGDALARGADRIKMFGGYVDVAAEVVQLDGFSAHADQQDLLAWLRSASRPARKVFVTHGEPVPADTLRRLIEEEIGCESEVPCYLDRVELT